MANLIEYEAFALHHHAQLMQKAKTSRDLNQLSNRNKNQSFRDILFVSRIRNYLSFFEFRKLVSSPEKTSDEKELISG